MDERIQSLTPELALIDPVLAAEARAQLPDPQDCLSVRRATHEAAVPVTTLAVEPAPEATGSMRMRSIAIAAAWLVPILLVASSLLAFIPPGESSRPRLPASTESGVDRNSKPPASREQHSSTR